MPLRPSPRATFCRSASAIERVVRAAGESCRREAHLVRAEEGCCYEVVEADEHVIVDRLDRLKVTARILNEPGRLFATTQRALSALRGDGPVRTRGRTLQYF